MPAAPPRPTVTPEQLELIRRTVAKDASDDELQLYLYDCARQGVHPLDKLIHFTKRGGKYTPITGIDFMRIQAAGSGDCLGISDPIFERGPGGGPPLAATVTVKRLVQGHVAEFTATARWAEYCPAPGADHMWRKMPRVMLGKCAEALALRKGFPKQLAGLYAREELEQGIDLEGEAPPRSEPAAPPPALRPPKAKGISTAQRKKLFAVAAECGWSEEEWRAEMLRGFGVDRTSELQHEDFEQLLAILKRRPRERADVNPEPR
jgi:phage recombination protein Bet